MITLQTIGWIGAFFFSICALPQVWLVFKTKNTDGMSWGFLITWFLGEVFTIVYVTLYGIVNMDIPWPLLANYAFNLIQLIYLIGYKIFNAIKDDILYEYKKSKHIKEVY